uniref:4Fe-4S dicluster domain-containing protein n=1 Tax=Turicimonas muris TaxID=1796652 RepID=UPI00402A7625
MKPSKYRAAVALLFLVIVAGGLIFNLGLGTVSSFGFDKIAAICPLGALETFLASKTFVPSVFFAFLLFIVVAVIVGRAFCGWMCPVPLLRSVLGAEEKRTSKDYPKGAKESEPDLEGKRADFAVADVQEEKAAFSSAKITDRSIPKGPFYVLFAALGSALVFGFPVFCLICPVGLTFGVILGVWSFFYTGSASWTLLLILAFLFLEIFFLRKWCHQFCPIGALISLVSIFNRSFRPKVSSGCYKLKGGLNCNRCSIACPEGIQLLYNPSSRELSRCIKCGKCADACPAHAIHFPLFSRKTSEDSLSQEKALTPSIASEEKVQVLDQTAPFSEKEAIAEASRCIQCGACEEKCPQKNPLRDYIRLLSEGRTQEAVKLLNASGSMPEVCGRICPQDQLCESVCPLREYGGAIQIGRLTSLGGDLGLKKNWRRASVTKPRELKRKTVAIIGAGPAGLAAADVLCSFGVHTTVFDKEHEIGGLLTYGIPFFKLEKESLAKRR